MRVIKISRTPMSAYDPGRPASALLTAQIEHLEAAAGIHPGDARKRRRPRTEGQAAKYIEELTRMLHPEGAAGPEPAPGPASARRRARRATTPPGGRRKKAESAAKPARPKTRRRAPRKVR